MCDSGDGCLSHLGEDVGQIWEYLNKLRSGNQLCDARLKVGEQAFPVHRAVLAASSRYFLALFTNGMKETGQTEIDMSLIESKSMEDILNYIYTRSISITMDNVMTLMPHADRYMIHGLVEKCCDFLVSSLDPSNCIAIKRFAQDYYRQEVAQRANKFIQKEFETVSEKSKDFRKMSVEELLEIIADDELNVTNEDKVWEAVIRWVTYDGLKRAEMLPILLSHIRLGRVSKKALSSMWCHPYVEEHSAECRRLIAKGITLAEESEKNSLMKPSCLDPLYRPRVPHDVLFVVGGWSGGSPVSYLESYDNKADRWYTHPCLEDNTPRAYHGMVAVGGCIYLIGGFDGTTYYNSVKRFDPAEKRWDEVAPMYYQRCYVSTTVAEGRIYALGGYDGRLRLDTAESYNPECNQWSLLPHMCYRRSDASSASVNGKVYIVGGFDGDHCLSHTEMFDPKMNQWTKVADMNFRRSGVSLIACGEYLYALGGFDGERRLCACEKYYPEANKWFHVKNMISSRSNFAAAIMDGRIITVGGFNGNSTVSNVESYDTETNEWHSLRSMNVNRSALKACVISDLENVRYYTYYGVGVKSKSMGCNSME